MIKLEHAVKTYNPGTSYAVTALDGVDLEIQKGEMIAVMGVSGSGKSTMLNIIGCMDRLTSGVCSFDGKDVSHMTRRELCKVRNEKIGFILQDYGLIEDKTVLENVMYPLAFSDKVGFFSMKRTALEAIAKAGIGELARKKVSKLSGGQKQRAAVARAIVTSPEIILADEPTAALDRKTADELMELLQGINALGATIVVVTHDKRIADMCQRTMYLSEGRIGGQPA